MHTNADGGGGDNFEINPDSILHERVREFKISESLHDFDKIWTFWAKQWWLNPNLITRVVSRVPYFDLISLLRLNLPWISSAVLNIF